MQAVTVGELRAAGAHRVADAIRMSKDSKDGETLGWIRWFGRWRQYAFYPSTGTIWNPDCLDAVNEKVRALMAERKA